MLRSDLCNYSDAYIVVKGTITIVGNNANNQDNKKLTFKDNSSFRSCISKINNTLIDNAATTGATFQINNAKLYVPVITLSTNNIKFLENIKQGSKRTISWNKYRSEITT